MWQLQFRGEAFTQATIVQSEVFPATVDGHAFVQTEEIILHPCHSLCALTSPYGLRSTPSPVSLHFSAYAFLRRALQSTRTCRTRFWNILLWGWAGTTLETPGNVDRTEIYPSSRALWSVEGLPSSLRVIG